MSMQRIGALSARLVVFLALSSALAQAGPPGTLTPAQSREVAEKLHVDAFDLASIDLPETAAGARDVIVETPHGSLALALDRHTVRAPGFRLQSRDARGNLTELASAPVTTWRGEVFVTGDRTWADVSGGRVAASITERGLDALVLGGGGASLAVQPLSSVLAGADRKLHLVYRPQDVTQGITCGTLAPSAANDGDDDGILAASTLRLCEIAIEGDVAYVTAMGSAMAAQADAESILNSVTLIYETYVGITYTLSTLILQAGPVDNYPATTHEDLLTQFHDFWNAHHVGVQRDVAHLLTSRAIDGNVVGFATVGVICNVSEAYGFSLTTGVGTFSQRVAITAHELGHNWNAPHCNGNPDCAIMCATIAGCSGHVDRFEHASAKKITKFRDHASCLELVQNPLLPPLFEPFNSLKKDVWQTITKAKVSTSAIGEPSRPKALDLDAKRTGADDLLESAPIDLSAVTGAVLSFDFESRGVEAGEELFVEYQDAAQNWIEAAHLVSDGMTHNTFAHRSVQLAPDAFHDAFRVRFRPAVGDASDDWFVDDLRVFESAPPAQALLCAADLPPIYATYQAGSVDLPADQVIPIANCGDPNGTLSFTVTEQPSASFFSVTQDTSSLTVQFTPGVLPPGLYVAGVKVQNDMVPGDFLVLPVTLIIHSGPWFGPGARLEGQIDPGGESDVASFIALGGTKLKLGVKTTGGNLAPIVSILAPNDNVVFTQRFSATAKSKKVSVLIPTNGIFRLQVTAGNSSSGSYQITTKGKRTSGEKLHDTTMKPIAPGGSLALSMLALPGTVLNVTVAPEHAGDGPFGVASYIDPTNQDVASAAFTRALPTGGVQVAGIAAGKIGTYSLMIDGFVAREKVRVTLDPVPPSAPTGTIIVP